jgi:hypothetical protein
MLLLLLRILQLFVLLPSAADTRKLGAGHCCLALHSLQVLCRIWMIMSQLQGSLQVI